MRSLVAVSWCLFRRGGAGRQQPEQSQGQGRGYTGEVSGQCPFQDQVFKCIESLNHEEEEEEKAHCPVLTVVAAVGNGLGWTLTFSLLQVLSHHVDK